MTGAAVELLLPQPVRDRALRERVAARRMARLALRSLDPRRRERRRRVSRRTAPAREAGIGSRFQGDCRGGVGVELRERLPEPGRAAAALQDVELV